MADEPCDDNRNQEGGIAPENEHGFTAESAHASRSIGSRASPDSATDRSVSHLGHITPAIPLVLPVTPVPPTPVGAFPWRSKGGRRFCLPRPETAAAPTAVQPRRAAFTKAELGSTTWNGVKVRLATEIVIGPTLGSPLGRISKLPVIPFWTLVAATAWITPARSL